MSHGQNEVLAAPSVVAFAAHLKSQHVNTIVGDLAEFGKKIFSTNMDVVELVMAPCLFRCKDIDNPMTEINDAVCTEQSPTQKTQIGGK